MLDGVSPSSKNTTSSTQKTANARAIVPARYVFWSCDCALRLYFSKNPLPAGVGHLLLLCDDTSRQGNTQRPLPAAASRSEDGTGLRSVDSGAVASIVLKLPFLLQRISILPGKWHLRAHTFFFSDILRLLYQGFSV